MKSKLLILPLLIAILLINTTMAQRHKSDTYEFKDNQRINKKTNVAEVLFNTDKTVYNGTPEQIARQFLQENKTVFGINNINDLKLLEVIDNPGGKHIGFIQTYKGVPVLGSETVVSINDKNQVATVANGCIPVKELKSTIANISKNDAVAKAKFKIKVNEKTISRQTDAETFIWFDSLYQAHLIWKVNFAASDPSGSWEILVDGISGEVLSYKDIRLHDTGQGKVFKPDPITALQNTSILDNNDADYQSYPYATVSLPNLNPPSGGLYRLQGTYARSENLEYPDTIPVTNSTAYFEYNRSQPGFEETNAYYFIDAQRQYVGSLGFSPQWNGNNYIRFDAHGYVDDNSWYDTYNLYLIFGNGGIDDAEDQDIVIHEYTHALHDALMTGTFQVGTNENLISEGIADYLAISYRRTLSSFQQDKFAPWDGNGETWDGRTLNYTYTYPSDWYWGYNYEGGNLWASTLMQIEGNLGKDITNKLILKSVSYANNSTIPPEHVYYVLRADQDIYGEAHFSTLGTAFYNRGFFDANTNIPHSSNYINGNITSNTTWSGIKWVNGNTTIYPGVTVTSAAFLFIGSNKLIFVENNATLIIQGTLTEYSGADIVVRPGGHLYFSKSGTEDLLTDSNLPNEYKLLGNYPNPFNPTTTIKYSLSKESSVELRIYDIMGREIKTFIYNVQSAGNNEIVWDGRNEFGERVASGVYIYRMKFKGINDFVTTEKSSKMILAK